MARIALQGAKGGTYRLYLDCRRMRRRRLLGGQWRRCMHWAISDFSVALEDLGLQCADEEDQDQANLLGRLDVKTNEHPKR